MDVYRDPSLQLDSKLALVLAEAERSLTDEEHARIQQREGGENKALDSDTLSRGGGPSNSKGKGPDPADWGKLDLSKSELDPGALASSGRIL